MEMGVVRDSVHARHSSPFIHSQIFTAPCHAEPCGTVAITEPGSNQFGLIVGHSYVRQFSSNRTALICTGHSSSSCVNAV